MIVALLSQLNHSLSSQVFGVFTPAIEGFYRVSVYVEKMSGAFVYDLQATAVDNSGVTNSFPLAQFNSGSTSQSSSSAFLKCAAQQTISVNSTLVSGSGEANIYYFVEKVA